MVPPTNPAANDQINWVSSNKRGDPNSIPKYRHSDIIMAANGAAGIPNSTVGIMLDTFCALLAPSQPSNPRGLPLPNFSLGWRATVLP